MAVLTFFKRIFAAFITLFVALSFAAGPKYTVDGNTEMTAVLVSDIHMEGNNKGTFEKLSKIFSGINSSDVSPDCLISAGDNTMNGQFIEWTMLYGYLQRAGLLKDTNVILAMGNHDFGNSSSASDYDKLSKRALAEYNSYCGKSVDRVYYSETVNGYKVIVLGSEKNMEDTVSYISDAQISWLEGELASAGGKPVIVVNHNLIYGTNTPQSNWSFNQIENGDRLRSAMESYDGKILYFCGHSHFGINGSTVVTKGNVTYVNLTILLGGGYYPDSEEGGDAGIGCLLSVYSDRAELSFRNFITGNPVTGFEKITITF